MQCIESTTIDTQAADEHRAHISFTMGCRSIIIIIIIKQHSSLLLAAPAHATGLMCHTGLAHSKDNNTMHPTWSGNSTPEGTVRQTFEIDTNCSDMAACKFQ
jgi:hypothetical protein